MDSPLITPFAVWQNGAAVFMARVYGLAGTAITQATVTSISYACGTVTKDDDGNDEYTEVVAPASLTVADVISDTLLTTAPWTKDDVGRNVTVTRPRTDFPAATDADTRCRVEIRIVPSTGAAYAFSIVFEGKINEIFAFPT